MVGRFLEKKTLLGAMDSKQSEFVAVYGRRRVGKTYLIYETLSSYYTFAHTGIHDVGAEEQLQNFRVSLTNAGLENCPKLNNWYEAFEMLKKLIDQSEQKKKVIFLDELPWLDTPKSNFLPAFEHFWNAYCAMRGDILLVICGSATSWIIENVINSHGGLYNRVTIQLYLRPFTLNECEQLVVENGLKMSRTEILHAYMIFGGIPFYFKQLKREQSLAQNIDRICFSKGGALTLEFNNLYASLFRNPNPYIAIINALCTKKSGMTREEISQSAKIPMTGKFSKMLEELEQCDFIRKFNMFENITKGAVFQLIDNFTLFHFCFMKNFASADSGYWSKIQGSPAVSVWAGLAFERTCLLHIRQIKQALGVSGVVSTESSWRCPADKEQATKGAQIDLLINRNDNVINICEMKHSVGQFVIDKDYEQQLRERMMTFQNKTKTRKSLHLTFVTTFGVKKNLHSALVQSEVEMDDLFV